MQEDKPIFRKIIDNEVVRTIAIITATVAVVGFFYQPIMKTEERLTKIESATNQHDELTGAITNLKDNHVHTIEVKVGELDTEIKDLKNQVIKIETMLNERLPNKQK